MASRHAPATGRLLAADDGLSLYLRHWPLAGGAPALILPGRAEPVIKYDPVAEQLRARGFAVWAMDWRGQGRSGRERPGLGWIADFDRYLDDLEGVVDGLALPSAPLVLGHSMGGHLALRLALRRPVRALLLSAPMVSLNLPGPLPGVRALAALLTAAGQGERPLPGRPPPRSGHAPFEGNDLTHDRGRFEAYQALLRARPELVTGPATIAWLDAALRSCERLWRGARRIDAPALVFGAEEDALVPEPGVRRFAVGLPRARYVPVPRARHELLQETDAVQAALWRQIDWSLGEWAQGPGRAQRKPTK